MQVTCQNERKISVDFIDENTKKIKLFDADIEINLEEIPMIKKDNKKIYYMTAGNYIYIILENEISMILKAYVLEQKIEKDKLFIDNIYSSIIVDKQNELEPFFRYLEDFEVNNIENNLLKVIDEIPIIFEKDYLKDKIKEFIYLIKNEDIVEKKFEVDGKRYNSLNKIAKINNIPRSTLVYRLGKGDTIEQAINKKSNYKPKGGNIKSIEITYDGITYPSQSKFLKTYGISGQTFINAKNKGLSIDEIVKKYGKIFPNKRNIEYDGETFSSAKDFCEKYNISQSTFSKNINVGLSIDEIVKRFSKKGNITRAGAKTYVYLGQEMTIRDLAELSGLSPNTIRSRIEENGWSIARAVETPV